MSEIKRARKLAVERYAKIDIKELKSKIRYEADTGFLYRNYGKGGWKKIKRQEKYNPGYTFRFQHVGVAVHDVVWLLHHNEWPPEQLKAIDGSLQNTRIENLILRSKTEERMGNYLVRSEPPYWGVKVWHYAGGFHKGNRFKYKQDAIDWAEKTLTEYNLHAAATEAAALTDSEQKETPVKGIYDYKARKLYMVQVLRQGKYHHYSYEKNIEDAIEAQLKGQQEINEIWKVTVNE